MKKFGTLFVLIAIIISSFAITTFAVHYEWDAPNLDLVSIRYKRVIGDAPQHETAQLSTYSDSLPHKAYVEIGCDHCFEYFWKESQYYSLDPQPVSVSMGFSTECWINDSDVTYALYDVYLLD